MGQHKSEWIMVTPEMAERWLDSKAPNRYLSENLALEYGITMEAGHWRDSHQGLAFDDKGQLVDGQHRLKGLSLLKGKVRGVKFLVTRGLTNDEVLVVDRGRGRSSADSLTIFRGTRVQTHDVAIASRVIHMSPYYAKLVGKTPGSSWRISTQDLDTFMRAHPSALLRACELKSRSKTHGIVSAMMGSMIFRAYYHLPTKRLDALIDVLATGHYDDKDADAGALLLREQVMTGTLNGKNLLDHFRVERAIKAFWKGQKITKIYPSTEEIFPLPEEKGVEVTAPTVLKRIEAARAEKGRIAGSVKKARRAEASAQASGAL